MEEEKKDGISNKVFYLTILTIAVILSFAVYINFKEPRNSERGGFVNQKQPGEAGSVEEMVGRKAPDFILEDISGKQVKLSDFSGKNVVLFFSEGAMCYPSCWNQIEQLANDRNLNDDKTASFSIVADSKEQWRKIIGRAPKFASANILFDTNRKVSSLYNVLNLPSSMHKGMYPGHTYIIVDKGGIVRYALDDPKMGIRNQIIFSELQKFGGA